MKACVGSVVRIKSEVIKKVDGKKVYEPCKSFSLQIFDGPHNGASTYPKDLFLAHRDSFYGRALVGAEVGYQIEVNIGGLSLNESPRCGGNHLRLTILSIINPVAQ